MCAVGTLKDLRAQSRCDGKPIFLIGFPSRTFFGGKGDLKQVLGPGWFFTVSSISQVMAANRLAEGRMVSHPLPDCSSTGIDQASQCNTQEPNWGTAQTSDLPVLHYSGWW